MIDDVHLKRLTVHSDDRGLLMEVLQVYDPADPDEERIPHDDPTIGFDWTTRPR